MRSLSIIILSLGLLAFSGKSKTAQEDVWVSKSDGAMSCKSGSGEGLDKGKSILSTAGIQVLESKKGNDGKARIAMCGVEQGSLNMYRISKEKVSDAQKLGFELVLRDLR